MEDFVAIGKYLPHRSSMLMVDRLTKLTPDEVDTEYRIRKDGLFVLNGYFTEAGLVENIAQTCSVIAGSSYFNEGSGLKENDSDVIGYITAIKSLQIFDLPIVGETLMSRGMMISRFDFEHYLTCTMKGEIRTKYGIILEGLLNLFIKKNHHEGE